MDWCSPLLFPLAAAGIPNIATQFEHPGNKQKKRVTVKDISDGNKDPPPFWFSKISLV